MLALQKPITCSAPQTFGPPWVQAQAGSLSIQDFVLPTRHAGPPPAQSSAQQVRRAAESTEAAGELESPGASSDNASPSTQPDQPGQAPEEAALPGWDAAAVCSLWAWAASLWEVKACMLQHKLPPMRLGIPWPACGWHLVSTVLP